mgnify:CR=1 FL=1
MVGAYRVVDYLVAASATRAYPLTPWSSGPNSQTAFHVASPREVSPRPAAGDR